MNIIYKHIYIYLIWLIFISQLRYYFTSDLTSYLYTLFFFYNTILVLPYIDVNPPQVYMSALKHVYYHVRNESPVYKHIYILYICSYFFSKLYKRIACSTLRKPREDIHLISGRAGWQMGDQCLLYREKMKLWKRSIDWKLAAETG